VIDGRAHPVYPGSSPYAIDVSNVPLECDSVTLPDDVLATLELCNRTEYIENPVVLETNKKKDFMARKSITRHDSFRIVAFKIYENSSRLKTKVQRWNTVSNTFNFK